jgi:hypothetical protein
MTLSFVRSVYPVFLCAFLITFLSCQKTNQEPQPLASTDSLTLATKAFEDRLAPSGLYLDRLEFIGHFSSTITGIRVFLRSDSSNLIDKETAKTAFVTATRDLLSVLNADPSLKDRFQEHPLGTKHLRVLLLPKKSYSASGAVTQVILHEGTLTFLVLDQRNALASVSEKIDLENEIPFSKSPPDPLQNTTDLL